MARYKVKRASGFCIVDNKGKIVDNFLTKQEANKKAEFLNWLSALTEKKLKEISGQFKN